MDAAGAGGSGKARIFLVDDNAMVRESLARLIDHEPDMAVCGQAETGGQALRDIAAEEPDLAVIDVSLPDMNEVDLIKGMKSIRPELRILVVTMHAANAYAQQVASAGATGCITKAEAADGVVGAVRRLMADGDRGG